MKNLIKSMQRLGIIAIVAVIGLMVFSCKSGSDDEEEGSGVTSLSLKTTGVKSVFLGNVSATSAARSLEDGSIPTLSYFTTDGKLASIIFKNSAGKRFMLEADGMDQVDDKRIVVHCVGYYEVTSSADVADEYTLGEKQDVNGGILIDMQSGRVFSNMPTWLKEIGNNRKIINHHVYFIEGNNLFVAHGWPNTAFYRMDLSASNPEMTPISSGSFTPMEDVRPPFTINGKIIGAHWSSAENKKYFYAVNATGITQQVPITWAKIPAGTLKTFNNPAGGLNPDRADLDWEAEGIWQGIIMKDEKGDAWMFTFYNVWWEEDYNHTDHGYRKGFEGFDNPNNDPLLTNYLFTKLEIDNTGKVLINSTDAGQIKFNGAKDQYDIAWNTNANGGRDVHTKLDFLPFYINPANGVALTQREDPMECGNPSKIAFINDGVYMLNTRGFVKVTKKSGGGLKAESAALTIPKPAAGRSAIYNGKLYYIDDSTKHIMELELKAGTTPTSVYSQAVVINTLGDSLIVSGSKIIFYKQEGLAVHTLELDITKPLDPPSVLATSKMDILAVAEFSF